MPVTSTATGVADVPVTTQQQDVSLGSRAAAASAVLAPAADDAEEYDYEALPENSSMTANALAGAFAGIMEHTVMYPVDAIKTRMQVANSKTVYSGIVQAVSKISAAEGAGSLWRGISSMVMGAGPAHAVYFGVYEFVKNELGTENGDPTPLVSAAAGAAATITSDALMNPFDVIKQRMQVNTNQYPTMSKCMSEVYKAEGLSAFFVSYPTTLMMNIPFAAINFTVYEEASKLLNPTKTYDPLVHCIAGGVAGATAAAITTPLDVVKTVLQTKGMLPASAETSAAQLNSFMSGVRYIYRNNGLAGFAKGMRPRIVSNMPSTAICWTSYEMAKFYLKAKV